MSHAALASKRAREAGLLDETATERVLMASSHRRINWLDCMIVDIVGAAYALKRQLELLLLVGGCGYATAAS